MAGGAANTLSGAVAPIGLPSPSRTQMKILCLHSKSTRKLRVRLQNPHQIPLVASKTILPIWGRPLQKKTLCPPLLATGGTNWAIDSLEWLGKKAIEPVVADAGPKFADVVVELAPLLFRVFAGLKQIRKELERMQGLLKKAEYNQKTIEGVGKWGVEDARDVYYQIDDVIDISCRTVESSRPGVEGHVERFISQLRTSFVVAWQIFKINLRIRGIRRMREISGTIRDKNDEGRQEAKSSSASSPQEHWEFYCRVKEIEVVGQEEEINYLSEQLISEEPKARRVISVVGMAGSGKTTLARKVYDDVKAYFDCDAFITLPREYKIINILMEITKSVKGLPPEEMEKLRQKWAIGLPEEEMMKLTSELGVMLRDHLKKKRYLVVVDDIRSKEAWEGMLAPILPDVENGRVLLTTRNEEVVPYYPPMKMRLLNKDEGWKLFMMKIFPGENPSTACPKELEEIGRKILAKCGGVPLAILAIGGLLASRKKTFPVWSKVLESVPDIVTDRSTECGEILALCYSELPLYLKPCFLYFGLFSANYEIDSEKLLRLWIAEGFIQRKDNEIMEDTAEDYLVQLINRSMIQASSERSNGSIAKCSIHGLFHDLSISKATEDNFFTIHSDGGTPSVPDNMRRLALHHSIDGYHLPKTLRSILCFGSGVVSNLEFTKAKLLRVVSQEFVIRRNAAFSKELKEFVHLRYLELDEGEDLPPSIGDLNSLQTLVLSQLSDSLAIEISNLEQLRHLDCSNCRIGTLQVNNLTNLQTLCSIAGNWIKDGFGNLTNLRRLSLAGYFGLNDKEPSDSIDKLRNLRVLELEGLIHFPQLKPFAYHFHLYEMSLFGRMQKLPELPRSLVQLVLGRSRLKQDAICILEKLPHLKILQLYPNSFVSKKMTCSSGGFRELEVLMMHIIHLEEWIIEENAMPSLKSVILSGMPNLKVETLPERVRVILKRDMWEHT